MFHGLAMRPSIEGSATANPSSVIHPARDASRSFMVSMTHGGSRLGRAPHNSGRRKCPDHRTREGGT